MNLFFAFFAPIGDAFFYFRCPEFIGGDKNLKNLKPGSVRVGKETTVECSQIGDYNFMVNKNDKVIKNKKYRCIRKKFFQAEWEIKDEDKVRCVKACPKIVGNGLRVSGNTPRKEPHTVSCPNGNMVDMKDNEINSKITYMCKASFIKGEAKWDTKGDRMKCKKIKLGEWKSKFNEKWNKTRNENDIPHSKEQNKKDLKLKFNEQVKKQNEKMDLKQKFNEKWNKTRNENDIPHSKEQNEKDLKLGSSLSLKSRFQDKKLKEALHFYEDAERLFRKFFNKDN